MFGENVLLNIKEIAQACFISCYYSAERGQNKWINRRENAAPTIDRSGDCRVSISFKMKLETGSFSQ